MANEREYLFQTGQNGPRMQAVIGRDGSVHCKSVDPKKMHPGDAAFQLFFHNGRVDDDMTPAQRETALRLVTNAAQHLRTLLGAPEQGFRPDMVVRVEGDDTRPSYHGYVVRETDAGILLRTLTPAGIERITHAPFAQRVDEVPGQTGFPGLVAAELLGGNPELMLDVAIRLLEKIEDEQALARLALGEGMGNVHPQYRDGIRTAAAARVTNQEALVKLCWWSRHGEYGPNTHDHVINKIADEALARITDQNCLLQVVRNICELGDARFLEPIVERLSDQDVISEAIIVIIGGRRDMGMEPFHQARVTATKTLVKGLDNDPERFSKILEQVKDNGVRACILKRLDAEQAAKLLETTELNACGLILRNLEEEFLREILRHVPTRPGDALRTGLHKKIADHLRYVESRK